MPSWFNNIPERTSGNFWQQSKQEYYQWGRNQFASSYASGGFAAAAYGPTPRSRVSAALGIGKVERGSEEHIRRLRRMANMPGANQSAIHETIGKMEKMGLAKSSAMRSAAGGVMGAGMGIGFIAMPAFMEQGGPAAKSKAVLEGIGSQVGWSAGAFGGRVAGAALGGGATLGVASILGGIGGSIIGGAVISGGIAFAEHLQDLGSRNRIHGWKWAQNNPAFNTKRAATMRAQSLEQMNRGQMSSRSLLGKEAHMIHQ